MSDTGQQLLLGARRARHQVPLTWSGEASTGHQTLTFDLSAGQLSLSEGGHEIARYDLGALQLTRVTREGHERSVTFTTPAGYRLDLRGRGTWHEPEFREQVCAAQLRALGPEGRRHWREALHEAARLMRSGREGHLISGVSPDGKAVFTARWLSPEPGVARLRLHLGSGRQRGHDTHLQSGAHQLKRYTQLLAVMLPLDCWGGTPLWFPLLIFTLIMTGDLIRRVRQHLRDAEVMLPDLRGSLAALTARPAPLILPALLCCGWPSLIAGLVRGQPDTVAMLSVLIGGLWLGTELWSRWLREVEPQLTGLAQETTLMPHWPLSSVSPARAPAHWLERELSGTPKPLLLLTGDLERRARLAATAGLPQIDRAVTARILRAEAARLSGDPLAPWMLQDGERREQLLDGLLVELSALEPRTVARTTLEQATQRRIQHWRSRR